MPITPGTFRHARALSRHRNHRAYAKVFVTSATGTRRSSTLRCLVDTGSDYTILPMAAANAVGLVPAGPWVIFRTAGGAIYRLQSDPAVHLEVEGYAVTVPVAFSTAQAFSPILGRLELVAAFDAGFDTGKWYWA